MSGNFAYCVLLLICVCAASVTERAGAGALPRLSVQQLRRLVTGYHVNRRLMSNYGQTLGQLQNVVTELASKSEELRQSVVEAIELAKLKTGLVRSENLPVAQVSRLDERQNALEANIGAMADTLAPKLQRVADNLTSAFDARLLLFKDGAHGNHAYRRLAHLLNHSYYVHGPSMSSAHYAQLRHLIALFDKHRVDVKLGEPANDLTSGAQYDADNTVFSRHPENLRHNAYAHMQAQTYDNASGVEEEKVADDVDRLRQDLVRFGDELAQYVQNNASELYFTGAPGAMKDSVAKQLFGMAQSMKDAAQKNKEAKFRLLAASSDDN